MLRLLFFSALFYFSHCSCPEGFDLVRDGECRGTLYDAVDSFCDTAKSEGVNRCKEVDGQIIIIHNNEQQSYWSENVGNGKAVIGLVCNTSSLKWEWSDGSNIDYKPPSYHANLDENCLTDRTWYVVKGTGYWTWCVGHVASVFDIFCTAQLPPIAAPSEDGCESFDDDAEDGVCYQVGSVAENWKEAQIICRSFGADLASIHNQRENSFIRRLAVSNGKLKGIFLGATVSGKADDFAWIDGSPWDYDNFNPGFPIKELGTCVAMDTEGTTGYWVNTDCDSKLSPACMRQQNYTLPGCSNGVYKEGQIASMYSPGFPFDASAPCDFILSVDSGKRVQVEVLFLEANSCCDHLILFDNYVGGNVIANLTGEISDTVYATSPSNYMRVSWQPNGGVNITFHGV